MFDVFIGHATEDKDTFVRPLATQLNSLGVSLAYDEFTLKPGDNLRLTADWGFQEARFGIIVLSPAFFALAFPERELDGLTSRGAKADGGLVLPIWHQIDVKDIYRSSIPLSDKAPIRAADGIPAVSKALLGVLRPDLSDKAKASAAQGTGAQSITPYTLGTLYDFVTRYDRTYHWGPHLGTIYQAHRQLAISTIEQLREAIACPEIEDALDGMHRKLLGRPLELWGKLIYMPLAFMMGDQGMRMVEATIMASHDYIEHRTRHRPDVPPPPSDFIRDPVSLAPELPPGWDGDAWVRQDETEYLVRAWNRRTGLSVSGRGSTFKSARYLLIHKIQDFAPGWNPTGAPPARKKQA